MGDSTRRKSTLINMRGVTPWLALALAVITFTTPASAHEPRVVCYYTNWSVYRPGTARFNPQNINPYLCTHLIYAFGGFTKDNALKPFDKYQDIEKGGYAKFTGLKTYNKNLKTLLAIGGWNEGSTRFSPMVASRERRKEFVRNAIKFLRQNRFDGLDLDWEYPAFRDGGKPKDRENYAKLVRELREEFERESEKTGKPRLLLTMAVPAGIEYIQKGFDVKTLNQHLDWLNLLTYDYHSAFEPAVNHHAPLYPLEEPNEYSVDNELNIDYTIKFYIENGADPDKLVLGIPTYGRSYTLFNADATDIGAPADGPGEQGDATREKGYLAYYEICEALKPKSRKRAADSEEDEDESESSDEAEDEPWTVVYPNPKAMGPVAYKGNQWVGYDDIDIVKRKAEYVAENGLGGIMFWSIDNDDFRGTCHGKPYPLIESAKEAYVNKLGSTDNSVVKERTNTVTQSSSQRRRNRPRVTTSTTTTDKPAAAAKNQSNKRRPTTSLSTTTPVWNIVTPEPPTTPDPGTDFKCTDEGFFPHPRDCKKYFWCLDSGPSNLGIVAHHFTCPSGLFFNKAADSCDFARNVPCKKGAATEAPATHAPTKRPAKSTTTTEPPATTRRAIKLSTKNTFAFRTTTTTTTTPEPEPEQNLEDIVDDSEVDAEDPRVIKELIDLIKKVGGVEQLEKHLHLAETSMSDGKATTTPASFNKQLYQKVLQRTLATSKISNSILEGQNSRRGPQNAGLEPTADADKLLNRNRPQYKTISRSRSSTTASPEAEAEAEDQDEDEVEEPPVPEVGNRARAADTEGRVGTTAKPLQYVNIRRARPTSTQDTADDTASRNALFERAEPYVSVGEAPGSLDVSNSRKEHTPEYVTIRRQRPTTEEATTAQYQNTEQEDAFYETILEKELSSPQQPQYTSIVRARSTTTTPTPEEPNSPEPTTVLSVQISSLLNSPNNEEETTYDAETATPEATETEPTTTTTKSTTTTAAPTRRTISRRRGTTTSTTSAPTVTTQVSPRNYTFVRRRRPLARPNEINSDLEDIARKVRSTTPDSLEDGVKVSRINPPRRFRPRGQTLNQVQAQTEDSVPAAASPVSRGQFRPNLNRDEVISLTPIDLEQDEAPQFVPREDNVLRNGRRFRPRTSTVSDKVSDSDVSAATPEVQRQNLIPRGRSRFVPSTTEATIDEEVSKTTEPSQRRPTFARFTPRPFSRSASSTTAPSAILDEEEVSSATPRLPLRLPFGRTRPSSQPDVQGRKLPFPSRRQSITKAPVVEDTDDLAEEEDKYDDINLSESAIEEKEHNDNISEPEELPKRRVIVKKTRPTTTTEENAVITTIETPVSTDETGRRKFRVIRRRPTSTSVATANATEETSSSSVITTTEAPSSPIPKIRKVIRKKINKPTEEPEPEIIAKSIGSLNSQVKETTESTNYGEKTRSTIISSSTASIKTEEPITEPAKEENSSENPSVNESKQEESANKEKATELEKDNIKSEDIEIPQNEKSENAEDTKEDLENYNEDGSRDDPKQTEIVLNPEAIIENIQSALDISDKKESPSSEPPAEEEQKEEQEEEQIQPETTTKASTQQTSSSVRARLPYRPPKRVFTSTTPSSPASSRTYSRKYNAGSYTSPATVERASEATRATRKPFFGTNRFRGRPFTTARTTKKAEEDEDYTDEELFDVIDQEPEDQLVVVPPSQLFTRKPAGRKPVSDVGEEGDDEDIDEDQNKVTSKKPYKPRVVNSNTFRTSTSTTELPRQGLNRTAIYNRLGGNKVNETKKRVQNIPVGYSSEKPESSSEEVISDSEELEVTTVDTNTQFTTENNEDDDDGYLTATENTSTTNIDYTGTIDAGNKEELSTATEEIEFEFSTDDYLIFTDDTTENPTTSEGSTNTASEEQSTTLNDQTTKSNIVYYQAETTETTTEAVTEQARVEPIVKTQFDKLFSVSRVVEVSSKLDKHRINKKNESRLIEEGMIMQEKKPTVDKIGEVSRFSLIKIFENEIPIYLTKLGHVYPVDNPPDNPIRIDEARNARALLNFNEGRENLIASESVNEAYRHINKIPPKKKDQPKPKVDPQPELKKVEHLPGDDFLSFINDDKKTDEPYTLQYYQPDPAQWQFIPAAYENEKIKNNNKAAKTFEIVTPRNMFGTDPSTLPLEGLFKTEVPAKKINTDSNQPFLVYSASSPTHRDEKNVMKLEMDKPESRNIKTYVKGQELDGAAVTEESTYKYPVHESLLPHNTDSTQSTATTATVPKETVTTSPLVELLTTQSTEVTTEPTTITTTDMPTVTETIQEETTTQKSLFEAKRPTKFAFPRRPVVKSSNGTRPNPVTSLNSLRKGKSGKSNSTLASPGSPRALGSSQNRTTGFNPTIKSRFTVNRSQNVPVDLKNKKPINTVPRGFQKTSTETPKTSTERRLYVKPIRPNLRPAFVPRRTATTKAPKRLSFPRRTKATAPPDTDPTTETILDTTTLRTFTRRGNSKFKTRTKDSKKDTKEVAEKKEKDDGGKIENRTRQPSLNGGQKRSERPTRNYVRRRVGGANATTTSTTLKSTTPLSGTSTRRPFRVTSRRRPLPATSSATSTATSTAPSTATSPADTTAAKATTTQTTSAIPTTLASDESLQELDDRESLEDPELKPRVASLKKTVKVQRRPLTSFKDTQIDQNPSATNEERKGQAKESSSKEEEKKRQSKKYSSSFKQNQLDEVLRQKSKSHEEFDDTTVVAGEDYSAETAVAIAAHQLISAPLPPPNSDYEDLPKPKKKKTTNSFATTQQYQHPEYTTVFEEDFTARRPGYSSTLNPIFSSSTPFYRSTSFVGSQPYSSPTPGYSPKLPLSEFSKIPGYSSTVLPGYPSDAPKNVFATPDTRQRPSGFTTAGFLSGGFSITPELGPSTARYLEASNKYAEAPIDDYGYTNGGLSREPSYFTREYLLESPVTKTYDEEYQYLSPVTTTSSPTTKKLPKKTVYRKISTTIRPTVAPAAPAAPAAPLVASSPKPRRVPERKPFEKVKVGKQEPGRTYRPIDNYDYYDDSQEKFVNKHNEETKVVVHGKGNIECLDIGNFPHPTSCKKFISCARMEGGATVGWEYICPKGLSFDPVGGICNWSAGLGCDEK